MLEGKVVIMDMVVKMDEKVRGLFEAVRDLTQRIHLAPARVTIDTYERAKINMTSIGAFD